MEDDVLNRKEAVAGLGIIGLLMLTLVGVIVYRIVGAKPAAPRSVGETTYAAESLAPGQPVTPEAAAGSVDVPIVEAQAASPIPIAADSDFESVPLTSGSEPAPQLPAPTLPPPVETGPVERPTFVAPGNRAPPP